jgi:hypothetical protein
MIQNFSNKVPIIHFYSWTLPPGLPPPWGANASGAVRLQGNSRFSLISGREAGGIAGFRATASIRVWPPKVRFPP